MSQHKIELREWNLGAASHQFWVRYEDGQVSSQIHGFPTNPNDDSEWYSFKTTLKMCNIKAHVFDGDREGFIEHGQNSEVKVEGRHDCSDAWDKALRVVDKINDLNWSYALIPSGDGNANSNSVAKAVGDAMDVRVDALGFLPNVGTDVDFGI